jgi:hypothetical protein
MEIEIEYDGTYPTLCAGKLVVTVDGKRYEFPQYPLDSGGRCGFDENGEEYVKKGPWKVAKWPSNMPEEIRSEVLKAINREIPHGCCGGCI